MRYRTALIAGTVLLCLACGNLTGGGEPDLPPEPDIDLLAEPEAPDEPEDAGPCCCQVGEETFEDLDVCPGGTCVDESHCAEEVAEPVAPTPAAPTTTRTTTRPVTTTPTNRVGGKMTRPGTRSTSTGSSGSTSGTRTRPGSDSSESSDSSKSDSSSSGTMKRPTR